MGRPHNQPNPHGNGERRAAGRVCESAPPRRGAPWDAPTQSPARQGAPWDAPTTLMQNHINNGQRQKDGKGIKPPGHPAAVAIAGGAVVAGAADVVGVGAVKPAL